MSTETLSGVSVATRANVYFDGKCVSHSVTQADGRKVSVHNEVREDWCNSQARTHRNTIPNYY